MLLNVPNDSDERCLRLLDDEAYRLSYSSSNGILTKSMACSILMNIAVLVDKHGAVCSQLVYESLNTVAKFIQITHEFHKDILTDKVVQEILLEDVLNSFVIQIDFDSAYQKALKDNTLFSMRRLQISGVISLILILLNFNKDAEIRATVYGYLIQILGNKILVLILF